MKDIKNVSIWKKEPKTASKHSVFAAMDINELNLGARSFNCLKRAGIETVADLMQLMEEDENGLRRIRNLGTRSETEIREKLEQIEKLYENSPDHVSMSEPIVKLYRAPKPVWNVRISEFHLSEKTRKNLEDCGIKYVRDLYVNTDSMEPGWFAVRELFEKILKVRIIGQ